MPQFEAVQSWLAARGWEAFAFQREVWQAVAEGRSGMLHATTGSGKTYAVWLGMLQALLHRHPPGRGAEPLRVVWLTPMRALASDTAKALAQPARWNLASTLDDTPISLRQPNGSVWTPGNDDHIAHGQVPMVEALAKSYNLASVHLGLQLGVERVAKFLRSFGLDNVPANPSLLLGARHKSRMGELLLAPFSRMLPGRWRGIDAGTVALAMARLAKAPGSALRIVESDELQRLGSESTPDSHADRNA